MWRSVIGRIEKKLVPWKRNFLSTDERLTLIKVVISNIPTYYMPIFKIPVGIAQRIEKLQRSFFWGDRVENRKVHVCQSKGNGGLGIGRVADKNKAMLAKWV
ncbi:hypothetical protein Ddye_022176 [Dipteronia dyeriana]|uniref:Uncharacterized protein n=1 Tax=Dipteronia dyeriana TaxID=168575 RepID=A0AAD9WXJ8_9ROSI|nr:hypothetical protein Ddye_022176 [Dipteronia dyeriana]